MRLTRLAAPVLIAALAGPAAALADGPPTASSAAGTVRWGGSGSNDLGPGTILLSVRDGKAKLLNVQVIMACTDVADGTESERAWDGSSSRRVALRRNRFTLDFSDRAGGRDGDAHVTGTLGSNGRGTARISLEATGEDSHGNVIERCQAAVNFRLRRGPSSR